MYKEPLSAALFHAISPNYRSKFILFAANSIMTNSLDHFERIFFIGIAGSGMSALAQYLQGIGKKVSGSDRFFVADQPNDTRDKLRNCGIECYVQDGSGINASTQMVVASTAVEDTVPEMQKAKQLGIPVIRRSELLTMISATKKTIAVAGTSGKSTTSALLFDILQYGGLQPSIISGAGLVRIMNEGLIGNAFVGAGEWLVIEADESDGSIVQYQPEIGLLLNIDKDHKEISTLLDLFTQFRNNSHHFIVNAGHPLSASLSKDAGLDFSLQEGAPAGFKATGFHQDGFISRFLINNHPFTIPLPGRHNMENALAAVAVARFLGVSWNDCAAALAQYQGIYRRHQLIGHRNGIWLIDDYAHNPAKCAASIRACQPLAERVIAWFQPHGFGPTRFLKQEFIDEIAGALRPRDQVWMSEIFYAGGTASRDISAADIIAGISEKGGQARFLPDRSVLASELKQELQPGTVILLMGARDPSLESFARELWQSLEVCF